MDRNLTKDVAVLTSVSESKLNRLTKACRYSICDAIAENISLGETDFCIEILFGSICCHLDGDELTFRFVPSNALKHEIEEVMLKGKNPLVYDLEKSLTKHVMKYYKELF